MELTKNVSSLLFWFLLIIKIKKSLVRNFKDVKIALYVELLECFSNNLILDLDDFDCEKNENFYEI